MNRMIITMPIAPYSKFSVGKLSTPILGEALAKKTNSKFVLAVNLLDSYKNRSLLEYQELLKKYDINPDIMWIDKEHIDELLGKIYYLIDNKFITEETKKVLSCTCKEVEIPVDNLSSINTMDSCFYIENDKYYCRSCHELCHVKEIDSLIFNPNLICDKTLSFYPDFINRDTKTFFNTVGSHDIIISRKRETGIKIYYDKKEYNLDIDFLWEVFLSLFPAEEKIVLCSNHQLYQLYMVGMLEKCFLNVGKTICLATPYLNIDSPTKELELENRVLSLKLFTLFNQKWAKKENVFDEGLVKFLNSMNIEKKQQLYDIIMEEELIPTIENNLKLILTKRFNIQNANQELKRRRRNV